jgi:O-antigen/teichoic acid export membrane protein
MRLFSTSFWRDFLLTSATETLVLGCAILTPALVARLGSMEELGAYLLVRRLASAFLAPLTLGMAVALPRFLPRQKSNPETQVRWSLLALTVAGAFALLSAGFMSISSKLISRLLLGSPKMAVLVCPLAILVFANTVHAVLYGHYRGMLQMKSANALQALNYGILPVLALLGLRAAGLAKTIELTGFLMLLASSAFFLPILWTFLSVQCQTAWVREAGRNLLAYGLARVPGFVLSGLLLSLGPIWLAHKATMTDVGLFSLAISFMRMAAAFFAPVGLLALPRLAEALEHGPHPGVQRDLQSLLRTGMLFALFACLQVTVLNHVLLRLWLGSVPPSSRLYFVPLAMTLPFYLAFEVLRNPIDAASTFPYNTVAIAVSLLALVPGFLVGSPTSIVVSQFISIVVLGVVSIFSMGRLYRLRDAALSSWLWPALYCGTTGFLTFILDRRFQLQIWFFVLYETALFGGLFVLLTRGASGQNCRDKHADLQASES